MQFYVLNIDRQFQDFISGLMNSPEISLVYYNFCVFILKGFGRNRSPEGFASFKAGTPGPADPRTWQMPLGGYQRGGQT